MEGRYLPPPPPKWLRRLYGMVGYDWVAKYRADPGRIWRKPKHPLAVLLSKLPEREAVRHFHKLDRLGAFEYYEEIER